MRYLFVTGKLAETSLRNLLADLALRAGFEYEVAVLNISVAALMTPEWIARHLRVPDEVDKVMLPGFCHGDVLPVQTRAGVPVERGPKDLRDLPEHFDQPSRPRYGDHDIEILAEINHAPRLSNSELLKQAQQYKASGADLIDLGCNPGETWAGVGDAVKMVRDQGLRVSIDSMNIEEIAPAARSGAELVLSVNSSNVEAAHDWGCEVVVVPDEPETLGGLEETIARLETARVPFRIDPIIEPIGFGFARSLGRYQHVRDRYPEAEMMLGIGNLTELTDVDSAGINLMILGFCQEIGIRSVLTTEVINWARSSIRELDIARRIVHHAQTNRVLPKHLDDRLILLRDKKLHKHGTSTLAELAAQVKDKNFRLFAEDGQVHVINGQMHLTGRNPFELFRQMNDDGAIDSSHAFYLGYEMAKAVTALTLHKNYEQDEALDWGFLTENRGT